MPPPKDAEKFARYRAKMRQIALSRGYGKWMLGKTPTVETRSKIAVAQKRICADVEERSRRSDRALRNGNGLWMRGRSRPGAFRTIELRSGKSYEEIYGNRSSFEAAKRRDGNRLRWVGTENAPSRDLHNADRRYNEWHASVLRKDGFVCQHCFWRGGVLQAHHVKPWALFAEERYNVENGQAAHAGPCHRALDAASRLLYGWKRAA